MIQRTLSAKLKKAAMQYPVITLTGPRQSGKTTLVKMLFTDYKYVSLENPDQRIFALDDPNGFLHQFDNGVILDEVQRTPDLFSYIQTIVDNNDQPGQFILTGSQNFLLIEQISQSLAGRTAIFHLLPFSHRELLRRDPLPAADFPDIPLKQISHSDLWSTLLTGFYPRIHDKRLNAREWLAGYYLTYIERDVRSVINVGDLETFGRFIRLCAGRTGQLLNFSSLAADCGISNMTAKRWLSVLQASFIVAQVRPHYENFSKRLIKSPKLYFLDSGLLSFLLGILNSELMNWRFGLTSTNNHVSNRELSQLPLPEINSISNDLFKSIVSEVNSIRNGNGGSLTAIDAHIFSLYGFSPNEARIILRMRQTPKNEVQEIVTALQVI